MMLRLWTTALTFFLLASMPIWAGQSAQAPTEILGVYQGTFQWDAQSFTTPVRFEFVTSQTGADGWQEVQGVGEYLEPGIQTRIKLRARYQPRTGFVEIWELDPDRDSTIFENDGSHIGKFVGQDINATWTSKGSGEKGQLRLKKVAPGIQTGK